MRSLPLLLLVLALIGGTALLIHQLEGVPGKAVIDRREDKTSPEASARVPLPVMEFPERLMEVQLEPGPPDSKATELGITLKSPVEIRGRVEARRTGPVSEFRVALRRFYFGIPSTTLIGEGWEFSDPDGLFTICPAESGHFLVQATAPGYAPSFSMPFTVVPDTSVDGVRVSLSPGGGISGTVLDADGHPMMEALISTHDNWWTNSIFDKALGDQYPTNATLRSVDGDADGQFEVNCLRPETYQVRISAVGYCEAIIQNVEVREGETTAIGAVQLTVGGAIRGSVLGPRNWAELPDALVCLRPVPPEAVSLHFYSTRPDSAGEYVLSGVQPGRYVLKASCGIIDDHSGRLPTGGLDVTVVSGQVEHADLSVDF